MGSPRAGQFVTSAHAQAKVAGDEIKDVTNMM